VGLEIYPGNAGSKDGGRWQPWNPTEETVLKKERNPAAMFFAADFSFTARHDEGIPVGVDLQKGQWVAPYGNGERADLLIGTGIPPQGTVTNIVFSAGEAPNGIIVEAKDWWSSFRSGCEAPGSGYRSALDPSTATRGDFCSKDEYLVVRCRAATNGEGTVSQGHYGKIYGPVSYEVRENEQGERLFWFKTGLRVFNPVAGDCNLEFNARTNLNPEGPEHYLHEQ
jgi:hypothetical protein